MMRSKLFLLASFALIIGFFTALSAFQTKEKIKIGFLVHDLVDERWKKEVDLFSNKVRELGGEPISMNGLGSAKTQVQQGKKLIDEGVKVIAVCAEDGKILAELVDYADKAGAKIIAYDRMILNCNLPYYVSFNSERVGEMMVEHALKRKPKGNYVIINGPLTDNNAVLVRRGIENKLKKSVESGDVKIVMEKNCDAWYALNAMMMMDELISTNKERVDAVICGSDGLAIGVIDAFRSAQKPLPTVITGQDASLESCKSIISGAQSLTIYKSMYQISTESAVLAMKLAKNEVVKTSKSVHNGYHDVPSILFDPIAVEKSNLRDVMVKGGAIKPQDLNQ